MTHTIMRYIVARTQNQQFGPGVGYRFICTRLEHGDQKARG